MLHILNLIIIIFLMKKDPQGNHKHLKKLNPQLKGETCPICMEAPTDCQLNSCSHGFCQSCILSWSKRKNNCPICRRRFKVVRSGNRKIGIKRPRTLSNNTSQTRIQNAMNIPIFMIPIFPVPFMIWNYPIPMNQEVPVQQPTINS